MGPMVNREHRSTDPSGQPPPPRFWGDFEPVAKRAFGVWTHREGAIDWARDVWKVLIDAGLVPEERDYRDHAVALITDNSALACKLLPRLLHGRF
jgi:hypothetical protein